MKSQFRHVALVGKYHTTASGPGGASSLAALEDVAKFLASLGCDVVLEGETAQASGISGYAAMDVPQIGEKCDLVLVVGGDGTMLGMGRRMAQYGVPLIGINQGRLGFITDIALGSFREALAPMLAGQFEEDHRTVMDAGVVRDGQTVFEATAMNDVVVNRGATSGMVELRVEVDGHFVASQRADGLIIASPTGSTAYALSAGGPLLHPSNPGWVLVPIAPHTLSNRPIVLPDASEIAIELVSGRDASANFDMQSLASLRLGDRVTVKRSHHTVRFLHPRGWTYFDTLRKKLHWNEGHS
ncbi:MAG TPA: NAD kinase [Ramlibacter sp.]|nr:NAD kinase [Ramlibacter sp.]